MSRLTFWYEFASTYSYLSAMRIAPMAAAAGVTVDWKPFLLGPIFAAQGWSSSPFNIYEAKGRNMWRDMARRAEARGLPPVTRPDPFPQHSLLAARVATHGLTRGWGEDFTRAMFSAQFAQGRDLSTQGVTGVLEGLGLDAPAALLAAKAPEVKESLRAASDAAMAHGLFGAPCFTTPDGELFWGDDRLEDALGWAARLG